MTFHSVTNEKKKRKTFNCLFTLSAKSSGRLLVFPPSQRRKTALKTSVVNPLFLPLVVSREVSIMPRVDKLRGVLALIISR